MARPVREVPAVKEAVSLYNSTRAGHAAAETALAQARERAAQAKRNATELAIKAELGDNSRAEFEAAQAAARDAEREAAEAADTLAIKAQAAQIAEQRFNAALESARKDLRAEYREEHKRLVLALLDAGQKTEAALIALQEFEAEADSEQVRIPRLAWKGVSTGERNGMNAAVMLSGWQRNVKEAGYID